MGFRNCPNLPPCSQHFRKEWKVREKKGEENSIWNEKRFWKARRMFSPWSPFGLLKILNWNRVRETSFPSTLSDGESEGKDCPRLFLPSPSLYPLSHIIRSLQIYVFRKVLMQIASLIF